MEREWYIQDGKSAVVGPVTTTVMLQGIRAGKVPSTAQVCEVGAQNWTPIAGSAEIQAALRASAPSTTAAATAAPIAAPQPAASPKLVTAVWFLGGLLSGIVVTLGIVMLRGGIQKTEDTKQYKDLKVYYDVCLDDAKRHERDMNEYYKRVEACEETEPLLFERVSATYLDAKKNRSAENFTRAIALHDRFLLKFPSSAKVGDVKDWRDVLVALQEQQGAAQAKADANKPTSVSFDELHKLAATGMTPGKAYKVCAWYYVNNVSQLCAAENTCYDKHIYVEAEEFHFRAGADDTRKLYDLRGKNACLEIRLDGGELKITGLL